MINDIVNRYLIESGIDSRSMLSRTKKVLKPLNPKVKTEVDEDELYKVTTFTFKNRYSFILTLESEEPLEYYWETKDAKGKTIEKGVEMYASGDVLDIVYGLSDEISNM